MGRVARCRSRGCLGTVPARKGEVCPKCARPWKPVRRDEARISRSIRRILHDAGYDVTSTEQGYRRGPGGTRITPGVPDLYVRGHGVRFWVEVKAPKGRLRESQVAWISREVTAGGRVYVWRSPDEAKRYVSTKQGGQ